MANKNIRSVSVVDLDVSSSGGGNLSYLGFSRSFEGLDYRSHEFFITEDANTTIDGDATTGSVKFSSNGTTGNSRIVSKRKLDMYGTTCIEFSLLAPILDSATQQLVFGLTGITNNEDQLYLILPGDGNDSVIWSHNNNIEQLPLTNPTLSDRTKQIIIGIEVDTCYFQIYEKINGEKNELFIKYQNEDDNSTYPTLGKFHPFCSVNANSGTAFDVLLYGWRIFHKYSPLSAINRYMTRVASTYDSLLSVTSGQYISAAALAYKTTGEPFRTAFLQSVSVYMVEAAPGAMGVINIEREPTIAPAHDMSGNNGIDRSVINYSLQPSPVPIVTPATGAILYSKPIATDTTCVIELNPPIELYPNEELHVTFRALVADQNIFVTMDWAED